MKHSKLIMGAGTLLLATVGAFASNAKRVPVFFKNTSGVCTLATRAAACTGTSIRCLGTQGASFNQPLFSTSGCSDASALFRS